MLPNKAGNNQLSDKTAKGAHVAPFVIHPFHLPVDVMAYHLQNAPACCIDPAILVLRLMFPHLFHKLVFSFLLVLAAPSATRAQQPQIPATETLRPTIRHWHQPALPALMTIYGMAAPSIGLLHNADVRTSRHVAPWASERGNWDSYLRWAPATGILALKAAGVHTSHSLRQQLTLQASAHFLTAGAAWTGKQLFKRVRPDGSDSKSFPSGHSAIAFTGATIWRLELKETHPVLSWGGYLLAGITAAQRVRHNEHWVSDVVGGAGVGILSAQASYWVLDRYRAGRARKQLPSFFK